MMTRLFTRAFLPICLIAVLSSCGKGPKSFEELKAEGEKAFTSAKYAEARGYFIKALAIKPSDRDMLYLTGLSYKRDYVYDSALSFLRRADILYPGSREINQEIYEASIASKSWENAARAINVLVATGDPLEKYLEILVRVYSELDDPLNVVYYLRKLTVTKPEEPTYALQLINALVAVDSMPQAVRLADSAIAKYGPKNELVASRANLSAYQGKYDEAENVFRSLLASDTSRANAYKLNLANVLSMQKDKAKKREAIELYKEIRTKVDSRLKVDSLITDLEKSL
jgi:tetratricopeptide (TPR) repeat protein